MTLVYEHVYYKIASKTFTINAISQFIRCARVCNHVTNFNARNNCLTAKLLQLGYRYHNLLKKDFLNFIADTKN